MYVCMCICVYLYVIHFWSSLQGLGVSAGSDFGVSALTLGRARGEGEILLPP